MWFDKNKFCYETGSKALCIYCPEEFDKWWDPQRFDWETASDYLFSISDKFDIWFEELVKRPDIYRSHLNYLAEYFPELFDVWWKPNLITPTTWIGIAFFKNLKHKFTQWWNPKCVQYSATILEILVKDYIDYVDMWLGPCIENLYISDVIKILSDKLPREKWLPYILTSNVLPEYVKILLKSMSPEDLEQFKLSALLE